MYFRALFLITLCCFSVVKLVASRDGIQHVQECLARNDTLDCLKWQALEFVNHSVYSKEPMSVFGVIDVVKDDTYKPELNLLERSNSVDDLLHQKIEEFFKSRNIKVNLQDAFEGRKKGGGGGGGKKGNLMFLGGLAMAAAIGQLILGKIAFIAGAALLLAKLALALSTIIGVKKLSGGGGGGGGGDSAHVVYATNPSGYGGHSHGSWHRSLSYEEQPQNPVYQGYIPVNDNNNMY